MQTVPLQALPWQVVDVLLASQSCRLGIRQRSTGLFVDLTVNNVLVIAGVLAQNLNRIVRSTYLGFVGDFVFHDTQGADDPDYTGLGTRFLLLYLEAGEVVQVNENLAA